MAAVYAYQKFYDLALFAGLTEEEIEDVLAKVHALVKTFRKSRYIYLAGDSVENLCVVLSGKVQMIKEDIMGDKTIIDNLGAGAVFAESCLGTRSDHSLVSYFAASDSEVLMIPFGQMMSGGTSGAVQGRLLLNILAILADNNTKLIEKAEILCKKTLRSKIMAYLEQEARRCGSCTFEIPFNRTDMANYLDADRSALTRELARMREEGLIEFAKNIFTLLPREEQD